MKPNPTSSSPKSEPIILASGSPRRKDLLQLAHIPFDVFAADVDETPPAGMPAQEVPAHLAEKKALAVEARFPGKTILAADTIVLLDGDIIGKPADLEEAKAMLSRLSGNRHTVLTGVCILRDGRRETFSVHTDVFFRTLTPEQISFYVNTYRPLDKAGSYAIQEYIGLIGIEKIEGDYYNVMGLPVGEVVKRVVGYPS